MTNHTPHYQPLTTLPWVTIPECDVTVQQIDDAIAWLQENREEVQKLLPLRTEDRVFFSDWLTIFRYKLLPCWEIWRHHASTATADKYIRKPIRELYKELNKDAK